MTGRDCQRSSSPTLYLTADQVAHDLVQWRRQDAHILNKKEETVTTKNPSITEGDEFFVHSFPYIQRLN